MKKISSLLLFAFLLASCYEDKGNYDYKLDSMNTISSVTFSPSVTVSAEGNTIEVQQALDEEDKTRRVDAVLEQSLASNLDELDFYWCRSYTDEDGNNIKDTIETKGYLEFDLPVGKPMAYNIFLHIYDNTTTLSHYSSFKLKTRPVFKNSLFVLHGEEGKRQMGNIEVIGNETKIYTDVKSVTKDDNRYENAVGFGYSTYINIPDNFANIGETRVLTVFGNNGETMTYEPFGMKVKYTSAQVFKPQSDNFSFKKLVQTGDPSNYTQYRIVLTDDGQAYIGNYVHALYKPGYACENNPDLEHETDYEITAATITHNRFLMWDAKNNRFLYAAKEDTGFANNEAASIKPGLASANPVLDANVKFQALQKSPEGIDRKSVV